MKQFVKASSAVQMLDAFENKLSEMKGSDIESATDIPKPTSSVKLTPEQEDLLWEIDGRYDNADVSDEEIPAVIAEIQKAIVKELGLSARDARTVMIDILGYMPEDISVEVNSSTKVTCGEYIDTEGMFGEPGAIITDDEMQAYWDSEHEDDPVLAEYPDFESWWSDTKQWLKPTDNSYADMYVDNQLDSAWGDNAESTMYRSLDSSTDEVDEELDPVKGDQEWGDDQVFMLMDYTPDCGENGPECDTFDCYGKFFAADEADANRQLEQAKATNDRMKFCEGCYIQPYNEYFDDGDEVYVDLEALVNNAFLSPNDYEGNVYDDDMPFASTSTEGDDVEASLIVDGEEVADTIEDIECAEDMFTEIEEPIAEDSLQEETVEASMGRYDDYFGQTAAKTYGDLISSNLSGQTVSKRQDLANEPGGLIYEADLLGIDMWELLEALEGMCYDGRAMEIDDSTYKIK